MNSKRRLILAGFALSPLAMSLSACGKNGLWPEGMVEIKWDRDTCARCSMVISDRRFAAQIRGGEKNTAFKFDDVGCAVFWLRDKLNEFPWMTAAATRYWVADSTTKGERWLDPRSARYVGGKTSPMGYNYAAVAYPQAGAFDWQEMGQHVLALGK
jgi:hypothetical protein